MSKQLFKGGDLSRSVLERTQSSHNTQKDISNPIVVQTAQNFAKGLNRVKDEKLIATDRVRYERRGLNTLQASRKQGDEETNSSLKRVFEANPGEISANELDSPAKQGLTQCQT